ncbi:uncharacterized protein LOC143195773 [Rhynchophorus ferrugineus]|uniref:uncharacterized protein LOC143195773 n=1 Tax=Rhynchophorus ferrugineus TaxID=354439 RepID=UPI003FCE6240
MSCMKGHSQHLDLFRQEFHRVVSWVHSYISMKVEVQPVQFQHSSLYCRAPPRTSLRDYIPVQEIFCIQLCRIPITRRRKISENNRANPAGNAIVALSADLGYGLALPDEPTHHPSTVSQGAARILDFFILQDVNRDSEVRVLDELDSDHRPILLKLGNCATTQVPLTRFRKKTDWKNYQSLLLKSDPIPKINTPEHLEEAVLKLTRDIQSAHESSTVKISSQPQPSIDCTFCEFAFNLLNLQCFYSNSRSVICIKWFRKFW